MFEKRQRVIERINAHDRLDDLHHVHRWRAAAYATQDLCALDCAAYKPRRFGLGNRCIFPDANCGSRALHNDRKRPLGATAWDELPPRYGWREPYDGFGYGHLRCKHRVVFMGCRSSPARIFLLVTAGCGWLLRRFLERRSVLVLRVLRTGHRAEVFSHRHL